MNFFNRGTYTQAATDANFANHWYHLVNEYAKYFVKADFNENIKSFQEINIHGSVVSHAVILNAITLTVDCADGGTLILDYANVINTNTRTIDPIINRTILFDEWHKADNGSFVHEIMFDTFHMYIEAQQFAWSYTPPDYGQDYMAGHNFIDTY